MSINDNNTNGSRGSSIPVVEAAEPMASPAPSQTRDPAILSGKEEPATRFATRAGVKGADGISKSKLILLGGGLAVAVLFFVFTAIVGKSGKKPAPVKQASQSQQAEQEQTTPPKGSVTPLMDTPRTPAPDNTSGQLGPGDIRRTRSLDNGATTKPFAAKPVVASSLGAVPSFADTQQRWEDPAPYGGTPPAETPQTQQNSLKETSIIFVRSLAQNQAGPAPRVNSDDDGAPRLDLTPGTRIQAKLETQISSAVVAPVVAVVEYTYAIGDRIVVPAGARVYGQLQQADRSGLVSVKFDEIELLDGAREKVDAVGTGLDLGTDQGERRREEHRQELPGARRIGDRLSACRSSRKQYERRFFRRRHATGAAGRERRHCGRLRGHEPQCQQPRSRLRSRRHEDLHRVH
jgi:hypothetical protein